MNTLSTKTIADKINLLGLDHQSLAELLTQLGEKPFRAQQLLQWIHQFGITDFDQMTNLSKSLRDHLSTVAVIEPPKIIHQQSSRDGTRKWLVQVTGGSAIETVFIPEEARGTLCVSSQVGCAINCSFCATGKQGFNRHLTVAEIIGQVWLATRELSQLKGQHDHRITNVVMMGMGEPLHNFDNVVAAMSIMLSDHAYGLSKRRVTLSTSGMIPQMKRLAEISPVALAVSLHAPNDELRNELVPLNKRYPLKELMAVCKTYFSNEPRRRVTFEYVMLHEVNDKPEHARQLVKILQGVPAKVNLIPFNPIAGADYVCSSPERIIQFRDILIDAGINTITRKTRGDDIDAACGQLVGNVIDRTSRSAKLKAKTQIQQGVTE